MKSRTYKSAKSQATTQKTRTKTSFVAVIIVFVVYFDVCVGYCMQASTYMMHLLYRDCFVLTARRVIAFKL
jgi:hypothetical protein